MRTTVFTWIGALVFVGAGVASANEEIVFEVGVSADEEDRIRSTVAAEIGLPDPLPEAEAWTARVRCEESGEDRVAQVEVCSQKGDEPKAMVYWIEPELRAGREHRFQVTLSARSETVAEEFRFEDDGEGRDVFHGETPVARYVTVYDSDRHADTHKPYHHVYGFYDDDFITKGAGGLYDHHKGLYIGWNQTRLGDDTWDFWHAPDVAQRHREYLPERELLGPVVARKASTTDWLDPEDRAVIRDRREVVLWRVDDKEIVMDFTITLEALEGDVELGGDAHHAGFQFRGAQEVADRNEETRYVRPDGVESLPNDIWDNVSWMAFDFPIGENRYVVTHMDHPDNPDNTTYSSRDYGRFGAFFEYDLKRDEPLTIRYRILIQDEGEYGENSPDYFERRYADFALPADVTIRD